jgi:predicted Zn-dependent protease
MQFMNEYGKSILPMDHMATRWVQAVAEKLLSKNGLGWVLTRTPTSVGDQKPDEWLVYVVDQPIRNAFVMPGNLDLLLVIMHSFVAGRKIVVFSGMLQQVLGEDQLAGILAHGKVPTQPIPDLISEPTLQRLPTSVRYFFQEPFVC